MKRSITTFPYNTISSPPTYITSGSQFLRMPQKLMECDSDEVDSNNIHKRSSKGGGGGGGGGAEAAKRPRGRPPGSKNKPKAPVKLTDVAAAAAAAVPDPAPTAIRTHILEIPAGRDVAAALAAFAGRRRVGICVLAASGPVADVTLRGAAAGGAVTLRGRFDVLSVSAAFLPPPAGAGGLSVVVAGPQGRVVGGVVAGPLVAAGTVVVAAAVFSAATFHRLPPGDTEAGGNSDALPHPHGGGGGGGKTTIGRDDDGDCDDDREGWNRNYKHNKYDGSADDVSSYSRHFPPDFLWAPTATRPPNRPTPH